MSKTIFLFLFLSVTVFASDCYGTEKYTVETLRNVSQGDDDKYFSKGLARVYVRKKWGYIDHTGKIIVPIIYDWVDFEFDDYVTVILNGKTYYYDRQGNKTEPEGNLK